MLQFGWLLLVRGPKSVDFAGKNMCVYLCVKPLRLWILFHIEYAGQSWSIHPMDRTRGNTSTALFLKLYEDTIGNEECMLAWPMKIHVSSLPPPRVSKLAFLQEEILVKKKKNWLGDRCTWHKECVCPDVCLWSISLILSLIIPEILALGRAWPEAWGGRQGPSVPAFLS